MNNYKTLRPTTDRLKSRGQTVGLQSLGGRQGATLDAPPCPLFHRPWSWQRYQHYYSLPLLAWYHHLKYFHYHCGILYVKYPWNPLVIIVSVTITLNSWQHGFTKYWHIFQKGKYRVLPKTSRNCWNTIIYCGPNTTLNCLYKFKTNNVNTDHC